MSKSNRTSSKQHDFLRYLADRPIAGASSIMELVRKVDGCRRGHRAGYAQVHRLKKRGMVRFVSDGTRWRVLITARGLVAVAEG